MNAELLYLTAARAAMEARSWETIEERLSEFNASLLCFVCRNILRQPHISTSTCRHPICGACKAVPRRCKEACRQCCNCDEFVESDEYRGILRRYKCLCQYVSFTSIYRSYLEEQGRRRNSRNRTQLIDIIEEGMHLCIDIKVEAEPSTPPVPRQRRRASIQTVNSEKSKGSGRKRKANSVENGEASYSVSSRNGNRLTIRRKPKDQQESASKKSDPNKVVKVNKIRTQEVFTPRMVCTCASLNRRICSGYNCQCYMSDQRCKIECTCLVCRNPNGPKETLETEVKSEEPQDPSEAPSTSTEGGGWRDSGRTRAQAAATGVKAANA